MGREVAIDRLLLFADLYAKSGFSEPDRAFMGAFNRRGSRREVASILKRKAVREVVEAKRAELAERFAVTLPNVLQELAAIAHFDLAECYDPDTGEALPPHRLPRHVSRALSRVEVVERTGPDGTVTRASRYTPHDKVKALDALGKHLGLYQADHDAARRAHLADFLAAAAVHSARGTLEHVTVEEEPGARGEEMIEATPLPPSDEPPAPP